MEEKCCQKSDQTGRKREDASVCGVARANEDRHQSKKERFGACGFNPKKCGFHGFLLNFLKLGFLFSIRRFFPLVLLLSYKRAWWHFLQALEGRFDRRN